MPHPDGAKITGKCDPEAKAHAFARLGVMAFNLCFPRRRPGSRLSVRGEDALPRVIFEGLGSGLRRGKAHFKFGPEAPTHYSHELCG